MSGKIFYRERRKVVDGAKQPRYVLVAVADLNLKVFGKELVALPRGSKHTDEDE
jgi:hypothetical protein